MTVIGIHPEELFDKLLEGELSPAEAERLRQHLQGCDVCRFEYSARLDFQEEALELGMGAPPALPLRPLSLPLPSIDRPALTRALPPARRARRRLAMVAISAVALITASAAVAAGVVTGRAPWRALGTLFSEPSAPPATKLPAASGKSARPTPPDGPLPAARTAIVTAPGPALSSEQTARRVEEPKRLPVARSANAAAAATGDTSTAPRDIPASEAPNTDVKEASSAAKLFGDANQARRSGDVGRASGLYRLLQAQFPSSPEAEVSRVTLALLLLDSGDAQAALVGFERYLAGASRGLEAEALVGRARALGRLGRRDLEMTAWQEVQRKYPRSIYGRQATERLSALGQP